MPRKVPCAVCGDPRWRSAHTGAPALPTCHPCRALRAEHGKVSTYKKRGCRCDPCREAWNAQCRKYQRIKVKIVRTCDQCGADFNPRANQLRCSASCIRSWRAANKATRRGAIGVNAVDPIVVYERDAWTCGVCELPVDPTAKYPDMGSASLDHIIPISRGGPHAIDNLQCAHFYCNAVKGARTEQAC